jgi:hypothetical protein
MTRILCEHWGTNVQEATHFFLNLKNMSNKKELDLATAARKRLVQQGVEPNPGPQGSRHTEFKVTTQNTGGVPGLWRALSQLADKRVLCCQDCPLNPSELAAFTASAATSGYKVYHQEPTRVQGRPTGGVATLIPKRLRHHPLRCDKGNLQLCWVEGIMVVNSYSAPGELQQQAEAILATMES